MGYRRALVARCIECGLCDRVCPSEINLAARFTDAKRTAARLSAAEAEKQRIKTRYAAHQQRLIAVPNRQTIDAQIVWPNCAASARNPKPQTGRRMNRTSRKIHPPATSCIGCPRPAARRLAMAWQYGAGVIWNLVWLVALCDWWKSSQQPALRIRQGSTPAF